MVPSTQWITWGSDIEVRVTEWAAAAAAADIVREALDQAADVCDLSRGDAEIHAVNQAQGTPVRVSNELGGLLRAALWAARMTGGVVSPFAVETAGGVTGEVPSFEDVRIVRDTVFAPFGAFLDLTPTAKAFVAHRAARRASDALECGVLVRIDDIVATWGHCPIGGWQVGLADPTLDETIEVRACAAMATVWAPQADVAADSGLNCVTVVADDGLWAYAAAAAAMGQGVAALRWLTERDLAARVGYRRGSSRTTDAWLHLPPYDHVA